MSTEVLRVPVPVSGAFDYRELPSAVSVEAPPATANLTTAQAAELAPAPVRPKTDVLYFGGEEPLRLQYGGIFYTLPPQAAVRVPPRYDYPESKMTGQKQITAGRIVSASGADVAEQIVETYGKEGIAMLFGDGEDESRMRSADRVALSFRIAQAENVKQHWLATLDKVRPGSVPPPQPPHVRRALEFLHEQTTDDRGRKRFITRDGRDFDLRPDAEAYLRTIWPELVTAAGGVDALITDMEAGKAAPVVLAKGDPASTVEVSTRPQPQGRRHHKR